MKHIVVPTDFSDNAHNALNYAINIANQFDVCYIHLLHVYPIRSEVGIMESVNNFMIDKIRNSLAKIEVETKSSLFNGTILKPKALAGFPVEIILEYADTIKADYIIMGTQGATGLKSVFMGSNTTGVIKNTKRPVLAIPSEYKYQPPTRIAFALDSQKVKTSAVLDPLVSIGKKFKSKVEVVHVEKELVHAAIDAGVDIYLSDLNPTFYFAEDSDVNRGINHFIQKHKPQMLCMIHRQRNFFNRLIFESVTKIEAFNSPVPLLVLPDQT